MKLSLGEILDLDSKLPILFEKELTFGLIYKLNELIKTIKDPLLFFQTNRAHIIKQFAEKDEKGNVIMSGDPPVPLFEKDNKNACIEKLSELINTEIDLDIRTFSLSEFDGIRMQMTELSPVFVEKLIVP